MFEELFGALKNLSYQWQPQTPERLLKQRKQPGSFSALVRYFGLGLEEDAGVLAAEGLPESVCSQLISLRPAVSTSGSLMLAHDHWPPRPGQSDYVYFGAESLLLMREMAPYLDQFEGRRVLDLGSGSGALSLEMASIAAEVLGLDVSGRAVQWAQASAQAQGFTNLRFRLAAIGTPAAEAACLGADWDIACFNPPLVVGNGEATYSYRDGGSLGIELPLQFLTFAWRHLRRDGEVYCLVTNPIVRGCSAFFDRMPRSRWEFLERKCLNPQFNQSVYRKERYEERGIERVELWFLRLRKKS